MSVRRLDTPAALLLGIAALSLAVRVSGLGAQSLWHDEGASLYYASLPPLQAIAEVAALGEIPPLYYLLLHFWLLLAGTSEFGLRFPSTAFGVLAVALVFILGRRLGGRWVGLSAAAFVALSPLHVWQSQELRMYTLVVALSATSAYLCLRTLASPSWRPVVLYALVGAAGLYAHFTFALVLVAQAVYLGLSLASRREPARGVLRVGAGAALSGILFAPWLGVGLLTYATGTTYWPGRLDVLGQGRDTLAAVVQGEHTARLAPDGLAVAVALALLIGLVFAIVTPRSRAAGSPALFLLCYLVVPAVILAWLLLDRPKYGPRYLLVALPAFAVLVGWATTALPSLLFSRRSAGQATAVPVPLGPGVSVGATVPARLARRVGLEALGAGGLIAGLGLLSVSAVALPVQASDATLAREDFRGVAAYLASQAHPTDAIILLGGHIQLPFRHYYAHASRPGTAPVFALPDTLMPAVATPLQTEDMAILNDIVPGRRQIWVVRWQDELADPAGLVLRQLEMAGRRVDAGRAFHGLHLDAFAVEGQPRFPLVFQPRKPLTAAFENGLRLLGYDLSATRAKPGDTLALTLYWRVEPDARLETDLTAFSQLLASDDRVFAQHDKPPVSELYKTSEWQPGDQLKDEYSLRVAADAPPGDFRLQIGLYDPRTMERVPVRATPDAPPDTRLIIADVQVR